MFDAATVKRVEPIFANIAKGKEVLVAKKSNKRGVYEIYGRPICSRSFAKYNIDF